MSIKNDLQPQPIDIISIQSQVMYGMVGNNAVMPVLQAHGFNVCPVPTVFLSNSPLYATLYGGVIPDDWFKGYLQALEERNLLQHCRTIVLGYLGSPSQALMLAEWLEKIHQKYPHIFIQIDPVLGDTDCGLYVDPALATYYRDNLRHLAQGMTPNHFELEYLCGRSLESLEDTIDAARSLLSERTQWIITTSAAPSTWENGQMQLLIVQKDSHEVQTHPFYHTRAQGAGDTFAATLTAQLLKGKTLSEAARLASEQVIKAVLCTNSNDYSELQLIPSLHSKG